MAEPNVPEVDEEAEVDVPLYSMILYWDAEEATVKCDVGKGINAFEAYAWLSCVLRAMRRTMPDVNLVWRWDEEDDEE